MEEFLLIDKPKGITSFDVVRQVKRMTGEKKVGHGGTLDPLATGLLIVALGKATKKLGALLGSDKEYEVWGHFGAMTETYDAAADIQIVDEAVFAGEKKISAATIESIIKEKFLGEIEQMPPAHSALKVNGKRAYELARKGIKVELKPRQLTIFKFEILEYDWPKVLFKVHCSSGTYIRSLIHDLGQNLGCGAYVQELRRTKVGGYDVKDAKRLDLF